MKRSLALSLLAAISGSTYAQPNPTVASHTGHSATQQTQPADTSELTESQRIMLEVRKQVGSELRRG